MQKTNKLSVNSKSLFGKIREFTKSKIALYTLAGALTLGMGGIIGCDSGDDTSSSNTPQQTDIYQNNNKDNNSDLNNGCNSCQDSFDCDTGQTCIQWKEYQHVNWCADSCFADWDCPTDQTCGDSGYCKPTIEEICDDQTLVKKDSCGNVLDSEFCVSGICEAGSCVANPQVSELDPTLAMLAQTDARGMNFSQSCPWHSCLTQQGLNLELVTAHVNARIYVITKNGIPAVPEERINSDINRLNQEFAKIDLDFVHHPDYVKITYLEKPEFWSLNMAEATSLLAQKSGKGWPIFYVKNIAGGKYSGLAYPLSNSGIILSSMGSWDLSDPEGMISATAVHEFGHQFGMYHTFEFTCGGTDCPNTTCATSGDFICDNSPDMWGAQSCAFDASACYVDCNSCYSHTANNIMSYWGSGCRKEFSDEQFAKMTCVIRDLFL
ncbi:hypothetical protein HOK51_03735 [Candidatus Woesearchaeota archaeon]|jgi:hypothetical protein|nr:hypothetical protein [Candidatus Woesearchaeota archaeon]MBT6518933.1 hypothetical protein [Candidatus Woesearchaeota archaeon]MBT7367601.1 hypothetical protein [Candidatus Woesearchaeota archaeon]